LLERWLCGAERWKGSSEHKRLVVCEPARGFTNPTAIVAIRAESSCQRYWTSVLKLRTLNKDTYEIKNKVHHSLSIGRCSVSSIASPNTAVRQHLTYTQISSWSDQQITRLRTPRTYQTFRMGSWSKCPRAVGTRGMKNPKAIEHPTYHLSSSALSERAISYLTNRRLTVFVWVNAKANDEHEIDGNTCTQVVDPIPISTFPSRIMARLLTHPWVL
jgi:hypothetical protein